MKSRTMKFVWYCYIFLLVSLGVARAVERILKDSGGFFSQYLLLILAVIFSIGVYGCINKKSVFTLWFWQCFYWISLLLSLLFVTFALYVIFIMQDSSVFWTILLILAVVFLIPAQIKIRQYGFKQPEYW